MDFPNLREAQGFFIADAQEAQNKTAQEKVDILIALKYIHSEE